MSKIIEFIDKVVEFPLRWTANIGGTPENITDLTRDPGTVYRAGTANKAEFFNAIQENGVFSVGSTIGVAGSVTTYTVTGFTVDGTFTIFEGFKISMKSSGDNVGVSKVNLLGTVYDVKVSNEGSYTDTSDNDIKTNDIILLEYRNGVFVYNNSLPKGVGLVAGSAKDLEERIEGLQQVREFVVFDGIGGIDVKSSFGVSGVVRDSTGNYTVTFTNPINENALLNMGVYLELPTSRINTYYDIREITSNTIKINTGSWVTSNSAFSYDAKKVSLSFTY